MLECCLRRQSNRHLIRIDLVFLAQLPQQQGHLLRSRGNPSLQSLLRQRHTPNAGQFQLAITDVGHPETEQPQIKLQQQLTLRDPASQRPQTIVDSAEIQPKKTAADQILRRHNQSAKWTGTTEQLSTWQC